MSVEASRPTPTKPCCTASRDRGQAAAASVEVAPSAAPVAHDFVRLGNAAFAMGSEDREGFTMDGEGPCREVRLHDYAIATRAVSNGEFSRFVEATGYRTEAERHGWSFVFQGLLTASQRQACNQGPAELPWWRRVDGACWSAPEGPGSTIGARMGHPVVHVSWSDAAAYCRWSRTRLPTEAEWEYAARGGLEGRRYPWGDELEPDGVHRCNIWQGRFPESNTEDDGYYGTAPVDAFAPNGFGLFNACGNVWEWCLDWFSPNYHRVTRAVDPVYLVPTGERSMRGGSFLCHHSYCNRYRVAARSHNTPDSSTSHCGFRVVADA